MIIFQGIRHYFLCYGRGVDYGERLKSGKLHERMTKFLQPISDLTSIYGCQIPGQGNYSKGHAIELQSQFGMYKICLVPTFTCN